MVRCRRGSVRRRFAAESLLERHALAQPLLGNSAQFAGPIDLPPRPPDGVGSVAMQHTVELGFRRPGISLGPFSQHSDLSGCSGAMSFLPTGGGAIDRV
jgi:hypothetical protein